MGQESCVLASSMLWPGQVVFLLYMSMLSSLERVIVYTCSYFMKSEYGRCYLLFYHETRAMCNRLIVSSQWSMPFRGFLLFLGLMTNRKHSSPCTGWPGPGPPAYLPGLILDHVPPVVLSFCSSLVLAMLPSLVCPSYLLPPLVRSVPLPS